MNINAKLCIAILAVAVFLNDRLHVESANILVIMPLRLKSHKIILDQVAAELLARGHNITYLSSYRQEENLPGMHNIYMSDAAQETGATEYPQYRKRSNFFKLLLKASRVLANWSTIAMTDRVMIEFLHSKPKFDVVLINAYYNAYLLAVSHYIQAPVVMVYSGNAFPYDQWMLDIPLPASTFVQTYHNPYPVTTPMTFFQRVKNLIFYLGNYLFTAYLYIPVFDETIHKIIPNSPPISDLMKKADFVLINAHPLITGVQPSMPHVAHIGGIHLRPAKPLNDEWAKIVNETGEEGFIIFSPGSISRGIKMSEGLRIRLLKVFRQIPMTVFIKYEQDMRIRVPKNIKVNNWFPLQDLMAHPKCRLFINHGGLLSTHEAMYHGVPVLTIPALSEHMANAARAASHGYSKYLLWQKFTVEEGVEAINEMLANPSYKENALRMSRIVKDQPIHPKDLAAYWVEYVIRHKGAQHLKGPAKDLNIIQYFSLDVISFLVIIIVTIIAVPLYLLCTCMRRYLHHKSIPQKKKKL